MSAKRAVAADSDAIEITTYWSYVEGELDADDDSDVPLIAHGLTLSLTITNATNATFTFTSKDDDKMLSDYFQNVWLLDECPTDPLNPNPTNTSVQFPMPNNETASFNLTDLAVNKYYVLFQTDAVWTTFDEDDEIEVQITTSVEQESISHDSSSSNGLLGLPKWVWYTIIGAVAALLILVLIGAIAGVFFMRRRARYESY
eukprot:TRINITY_DN7576_c0_g1_i1.p2 TRINITY_DN7576_c0_g1~~TRINITY_DN7576_c0_g1_i1.p2  ORF type:complete len:201 (-),score=89.32 TRINITY_DN7576_c0_g1_i1:743-1345(-)